jgi:predicted Holliday junction resolvase-like endonuclease
VDPLLAVSTGLIVAVLALVLVVRGYHDKVTRLQDELKAAQSSRQSLATTYGRITEQWAPFMAGYPYEPRGFRFLGSPVDGVQFEDDKVVFVEFKANTGSLTERERRIKENVQAGRVEWLEFRLAETPLGSPPPPDFQRSSAWRRD